MATLAIVAVAGAGAWGATAVGISAAAGWTLGSLVGSLLFAKGGGGSDQVGPRLENLKVTSATRGTPIKRVYGTSRIGGNLMWTGGLVETKHEDEVGKGGSETVDVIWYTYSASFTIALCEGPITGVRRIWADAKLIYDIGSAASATQVLVSKTLGYTIYNGDETQLPSALPQAVYGTNDVPGSRGIACIEFNNMQLEQYGNRIPNITAEVVGDGDTTSSLVELATDVAPHFLTRYWDVAAVWDGGPVFNYVSSQYQDSNYNAITVKEYRITAEGVINNIKQFDVDFGFIAGSIDYHVVVSGKPMGNQYLLNVRSEDAFFTKWSTFKLYTIDSNNPPLEIWTLADPLWAIFNIWTKSGDYLILSGTTWKYLYVFNLAINPPIIQTITPIDFVNDAFGGAATGGADQIELYGETLFARTRWAGGVRMSRYELDFGNLTAQFVNALDPLSFDASYDVGSSVNSNFDYTFGNHVEFKTIEAWGTEITRSDVHADTFRYGAVTEENHFTWLTEDGFVFWTSGFVAKGEYVHQYKDLSSNTVTLQSVITAICEGSGLTAADIDVSTLTDTVTGYPIGRQERAANSLEPLLTAYGVTTAESNWKIVFLKADDVTAEAVDVDEFGATAKKRANELVATRMMDSDLPRRINVQYSNFDTDYQTAVQRAQRINS